MEFLKTCNTNALAIGEFEAVTYQAFSIARNSTNFDSKLRDWNTSEDIRAVEAELRLDLHLVTQDTVRPWLWLFQPVVSGQAAPDIPVVEGYHLHSEQAGSLKAAELARPPGRSTHPNASTNLNLTPSTPTSQRGMQGSQSHPSQSGSQTSTSDESPPPLDCFVAYELFTSSVVALVLFHLVKECSSVALNYRTFVSQPWHPDLSEISSGLEDALNSLWITSINVHWISSGTLLLSTFTERNLEIRCLNDITTSKQEEEAIGRCVRVAPNGSLAKVVSFEDPLDAILEETTQRQRKRAKLNSLEQSVEKWKSTVRRWLSWRGYSLPDLDKKRSWVRLRAANSNSAVPTSPTSATFDRDLLWPRALCFFYADQPITTTKERTSGGAGSERSNDIRAWFETAESKGYRDPLDVAQDWFLGKPNRDKVLDAHRKAKKAEEDAARRKDEQQNLLVSSPLNARSGVYGDLQAVSGVYPTPPDGVVPGTGVSYSDTTSVSGAPANVILPPGGNNPAINLSGPQDHAHADLQNLPAISPGLPSGADHFSSTNNNDDLFEDMDDGYGGAGVDDADFDFFDGPGDEDVDMLDVSAHPENIPTVKKTATQELESTTSTSVPIKQEPSELPSAHEDGVSATSKPEHKLVPKEETNGDVVMADGSQEATKSAPEDVQPQVYPKIPVPKQPTPPLSPSMIAKALRSSPQGKLRQEPLNVRHVDHSSAFDPVNFSRKMSLSDAKYQEGRFMAHRAKDSPDESSPTAHIKGFRELSQMTKHRSLTGVNAVSTIPEITALARAVSDDSDSSDSSSDDSDDDSDDETTTGRTVTGPLILPAKRKLPAEGNATPLSVTSFADSFGGDWQDLQNLHLDETLLTNFEPRSWDWSLVNLPSPSERSLAGARYSMPALTPSAVEMPDTPTSQFEFDQLDEKNSNPKDTIAIAQIMTDQIVSATLDVLGEGPITKQTDQNCRSPDARWHTVINKIFPAATECNLVALIAVADVFPEMPAQARGHQRPPPRKPNEGAVMLGSHMFPVNAPFLRVRRADTHWDLLPPAVAFWEPLGLAPVSPPKNVVGFCVYPHSDSIKPYLENFLLNLQLAYDSCKLGSHTRVDTVLEFDKGLVPCKVTTTATRREVVKTLRTACVQLGKLLAIQHAKIREQLENKIDAFVIYMVDPFDDPAALYELSSAFWALFQAYGAGPGTRPDQPQKPDLVLQVVNMKYIASLDAPVILDPSTYVNLAREVYNRCPPSAPGKDKTTLSIYSAPAFHLEETLPRTIPFKLIPDPPQDLLRENCYMHIGYAISMDGTWMTAAWTDTCGKSQAVVSYHLGTRNFGDIAKEIWQTTIDIVQSRRVHWRICVAKAGVMDREELETWVMLMSCPTQVNLFITLITVDTTPPYKFTPTSNAPGNTASQQSVGTPDSTPQAVVSPDQGVALTPAATPSADPNATDPAADPDSRLIDVTDETWAVILAHRLHNSNSTNQFAPALISSLLIKRGETFATSSTVSHPIPDPEHGPIVVGVNILWIGAVGSTRAATSPFPPSASGDGVSPGGGNNPYANNNTPPSPSPASEGGVRSTSSLMWTPTPQTRGTAENLLKDVLSQYRALGLLAKLKGMRGTRHGTIPWHIAAAKRGAAVLEQVMSST